MQETALQLVTAPSWPKHLKSLRADLRQRRDHLAAAVRARLGQGALRHVPAGGLHLWVALPPGTSDSKVASEAAARGVLVSAGRHWFPAEAPEPHLRLSFAGARPEWVDEAVGIVADVIAKAGPA